VCGGYTPTDLDSDVFDYCREGRTDEIPDIEERCNGFKDKSRYIELPEKVYQTDGVIVYESTVKNVIFETEGIAFDKRAIGQSVFLTREEAEKALKGGDEK
jgi:hypothetical protein